MQGYVWGRPVEPLLDALQGSSSEPTSGFDLIILSDLIFNHSQAS
jgi:nicotinamide N-methyltransferase